MNLRHLSQRRSNKNATTRSGPDKSTALVLDLSPSKIQIEEAATLAFNARRIRSRYNNRRDLLILQFDTPHEKLAYFKRLPQWLWNRGCVVWEFSQPELALWMQESIE